MQEKRPSENPANLTARLAAFAARPLGSPLPQEAEELATLCLQDWAACALAGTREPVASILRSLADKEQGAGSATLLGHTRKGPARLAALVNGATSHALDYDDTHFAYVGHPSVVIFPASLAAAEEANRPAKDLLEAYAIGAEIAVRVGIMLGADHYNAGFHQTATAGAFGATAAAGRLLGLGEEQMHHALSLCTPRASGLKVQFGTMGKPLNAGFAAANGVEAAVLASLGATSCADGLSGSEGFLAAHHARTTNPAEALHGFGSDWLFEDVRFKLHACCHGLHAALEALTALKESHDPDPAAMERIAIRTAPRWMSVCNIKAPATGLEAKFSYAMTAAMVLAGHNTGALESFSDAACTDETLIALRNKVRVSADDSLTDTQTAVTLGMTDGSKWTQTADIAPQPPLESLQKRIFEKSAALLGPQSASALRTLTADLADLSARDFARQLNALAP